VRHIQQANPLVLLPYTDVLRDEAYSRLNSSQRAAHGQYFTPSQIADFMASLLMKRPVHIRLLDAGAGVGALTAAAINEICSWDQYPSSIHVTAYEIDPVLVEHLQLTLNLCAEMCQRRVIHFSYEIVQRDFIESAVEMLQGGTLFEQRSTNFNIIILNPPYHKINSSLPTRRLLRMVGIETTNLYSAFVWLSMLLLEDLGEIVAITPRSFCNGSYFKSYREALLNVLSIKRIHIFNSRTSAFAVDSILQENIIFHGVKEKDRSSVLITSSDGLDDEYMTVRNVKYNQIIQPGDINKFIRIVADDLGFEIDKMMNNLIGDIDDMNMTISTGRVVEFRAKHLLKRLSDEETFPVIYPAHLRNGRVVWPNNDGKKYNGIITSIGSEDLLVPTGFYVLVKRLSAKEEKRRIVAALYDPKITAAKKIGFENHLNYYHIDGCGLPEDVAKGLVVFLNSTLVDQYFRQFNGHTQVNATDLRNIRYPSIEQLIALGSRITTELPSQDELDQIVQEGLNLMADSQSLFDPIQAKKRIAEALVTLKALNVPNAQQNDRSALTLLALLNLKSVTPWNEAANPLLGITEMMEYFRLNYGVAYAPNTRETVRRETVHQFVELGLVRLNPDDPSRPPNSPKTRYQIEENAFLLLKTFGTTEWDKNLVVYLENAESIRHLHARERAMSRIPVTLPDGREIFLSGGGQNTLIKAIIEEFCPRFTPGGIVVYLGDAGQKLRGDELEYLRGLGVDLDPHGKIPDVIVHVTDRNWLVLIEAVTSHGPVNIKRLSELRRQFQASTAPLVFVTAFATRKAMVSYLADIAWETEVWIADAPSHLIHFNGDRFLGPHDHSEDPIEV
jgi:adenine-specific DNA-methyltransferase